MAFVNGPCLWVTLEFMCGDLAGACNVFDIILLRIKFKQSQHDYEK